jgi:hypothetical protein
MRALVGAGDGELAGRASGAPSIEVAAEFTGVSRKSNLEATVRLRKASIVPLRKYQRDGTGDAGFAEHR